MSQNTRDFDVTDALVLPAREAPTNDKILAMADNVVVQIVEQRKTAGGLFIPEKARGNQRDAIVAKVVSVGPGRVSEYGARILPEARVGEYVLLARGAGVEVELSVENTDGRRLRILRDCELLGRVEESRIISLGLQP